MYKLIVMISLLGGGISPNSAQQKTINVDSLFESNINELKIIVNDSKRDRDLIGFMWMISLIGNKEFVDPHKPIQINKRIISEIEQWYINNKPYITSDNIEKAYNILYPPETVFESCETWMEWMDKQYNGLEVKAIK